MAYTYVEVEVDLQDFSDKDLIMEMKERGYMIVEPVASAVGQSPVRLTCQITVPIQTLEQFDKVKQLLSDNDIYHYTI